MEGTLQEGGKTSSMRVAMMMCVATACYLAIAGLHMGVDLFQVSSLVVVFLAGGFTGKVVQKQSEIKSENADGSGEVLRETTSESTSK